MAQSRRNGAVVEVGQASLRRLLSTSGKLRALAAALIAMRCWITPCLGSGSTSLAVADGFDQAQPGLPYSMACSTRPRILKEAPRALKGKSNGTAANHGGHGVQFKSQRGLSRVL